MLSARDRALAAFREAFGNAPTALAGAPGRVNLIGEHTDYNLGLVLPFAIGLRTWAAAGPSPGGQARIVAADLGREVAFDAGDPMPTGDWADVVRGVAAGIAGTGGFDLAVAGDVPMGAGLSSSAALGVAVALALGRIYGHPDPAPRAIARLVRRAETDYAGVRCGIMDQLAVAAAKPGTVMLIDCQDLAIAHLQWTLGQYRVVVMDSGEPRSLAASGYNARRAECEEAVRVLASGPRPGLASLREVAPSDLEEVATALPSPLDRRVRHVVTENARVLAARSAIEAGDAAGLGLLLSASHASLARDYEVSTPALDRLVALAKGTPGVAGARLVGAGFGGSAIALVEADAVEGLGPGVIAVEPAGGPEESNA